VWERIKAHKVAQWTLAYIAVAYTVLHGVEMLSGAQEWPHVIARVVSILLVIGVPVVATLAFYHGARGMSRVSTPEFLIITLLGVIAGSILWSMERSAGEGSSTEPRNAASAQRAETAYAPAEPPPSAQPQPAASSIAVMPFANLTGDPTKEYLGDGMTEEIINALSQVPGLKVPARTSSFAYKGRNTDIRQFAKDLGVATVLEGSVRSEGKHIRITAQLIDAQDGLHVWSKTYDEELTDLFKLQDDLAHSIAEALKVSLATGGSPLPVPAQSLEAYQLYLQADAVSRSGTAGGMQAGLELARQAVAKDPSFARAHALIAQVRAILLPSLGPSLREAIDDARREADLALRLQPKLPAALQALGQLESITGNWVDAEKHYRTALSLEAADPVAHISHGLWHLNSVGHLEAALAEMREAQRLAPALPVSSTFLALELSLIGADEEAVRFADLALRLSGDPNPLASVYFRAAARRGDIQGAAHKTALSFSPALQSAGIEAAMRNVLLAYRDPTQRSRASQALQRVVAIVGEAQLDLRTSAAIASWYIWSSDLDAAYRLLTRRFNEFERAGVPGYQAVLGILWAPDSIAFRRDRRFQSFVDRLDMMPYWKQFGPPDGCELQGAKLLCH
jgi:serine/threonine-protein kinase